ncbi:MAG: GNAT family N-acetyltransferase [Polyangiales bacterium]
MSRLSKMVWHCTPFAALEVTQLYEILRLRQRVFGVEQACAYLDADGRDPLALHLWATTLGDAASGDPCCQPAVTDSEIVAYARLFGPNVMGEECSIGRVATAPEARRRGFGRALMARALEETMTRFPARPIGISAQAYLERFYASFGFERRGDDYLDDGIPHVAMMHPGRPGR